MMVREALFDYWRFRILLVLLIGVIFVGPLLHDSIAGESLLVVIVGVISSVTLWVTKTRFEGAGFGTAIVGAWVVIAFVAIITPTPWLEKTQVVIALIMSLLMMWSVFAALFREASADIDGLAGAIFGYFLLAVVWAQVYKAVEMGSPGSFAMPEAADPTAQLVYFSLVTITTLGYGDILPVSPLARMLAGVEAAVGVLYIAILIGRIVGVFKRPDES
jgi:voltage-gated potassium channel